MNNVTVTPVVYGRSTLSESMIFQDGAKERSRPIVFAVYLIRAKDKIILVDTGCVTMPGFVMEDFVGPVNALAKLGLSPLDLTDVIVTHAHHDHIECVGEYKNARIFIQKDEYELGKRYFTDDLTVVTFDEYADVCENVRAVKIGGHSKGSCIVTISGEKTTIIAGDECYSRECLEKRIPTGSSVDIEKSRDFVNEYSKDKYNVLLCHEL